MKVCFVTPYSPREISGVGKIVASLGRGLVERNHSHLILTKSTKEGGSEIPGLIEIDYRKIKFIGGLLLILRALFAILKERKSIDIIHSHSVSWLTAVAGLWGHVLGIPTVLTLHGKHPPPSGFFSKALFRARGRLAIASPSKITCVSSETKGFYQLDAAIVIRNGIDTSRFIPNPEERSKKRVDLELGDSFVVLFLGRLDAKKGVYELLEVTKDLVGENSRIKLLLVGSGEDESVRDAIEEKSLKETVIQVGKVENPVPFYQCSDIFVLFSALEGIPLTLLEAMACELPCIATSVGGISEVITNGIDGFLIEPGDEEALKRHVLWCVDNASNLEDISTKARRRTIGAFDVSKMLDDYVWTYGSVIES
jgi:glycosyltransferase involved in cell wall biosynthesis